MMVIKNYYTSIFRNFSVPVPISTLVVGRILFGLVMFVGIIRFIFKGWVRDLYITPTNFFKYYGFEWVVAFDENGMFILFGLMIFATLGIAFGFFYRISAAIFFFCFTYVELIDKSTYLNHYYFISIFSLLLILVPANRSYSIDVILCPSLKRTHVPKWTISILLIQIGLVYFFAGLAKLNSDWLFRAMPLKIWLSARTDFPVIGKFFDLPWVPFLFSWAGAIYDLLVPFGLLSKKYRLPSYLAVVGFHFITGFLFPIGMFPLIMILLTLMFFTPTWHQSILDKIFGRRSLVETNKYYSPSLNFRRIIYPVLGIYFAIQILLPFRYWLYPGELFWTEEGFRFSWRVMLIEKAGAAFFYVKNPDTGIEVEVRNCDYLTPLQEKMMATQPDMILEFAHILKRDFEDKGITDPEVRVKSYVSLNGRGSELFIDERVNLVEEVEGFDHKSWILPFNDKIYGL